MSAGELWFTFTAGMMAGIAIALVHDLCKAYKKAKEKCEVNPSVKVREEATPVVSNKYISRSINPFKRNTVCVADIKEEHVLYFVAGADLAPRLSTSIEVFNELYEPTEEKE